MLHVLRVLKPLALQNITKKGKLEGSASDKFTSGLVISNNEPIQTDRPMGLFKADIKPTDVS